MQLPNAVRLQLIHRETAPLSLCRSSQLAFSESVALLCFFRPLSKLARLCSTLLQPITFFHSTDDWQRRARIPVLGTLMDSIRNALTLLLVWALLCSLDNMAIFLHSLWRTSLARAGYIQMSL